MTFWNYSLTPFPSMLSQSASSRLLNARDDSKDGLLGHRRRKIELPYDEPGLVRQIAINRHYLFYKVSLNSKEGSLTAKRSRVAPVVIIPNRSSLRRKDYSTRRYWSVTLWKCTTTSGQLLSLNWVDLSLRGYLRALTPIMQS